MRTPSRRPCSCLQVYKQRIKHLLFEYQSAATGLRTEGVTTLRVAQETHRDAEAELRGDGRDLKATLREMEASHDDFMK